MEQVYNQTQDKPSYHTNGITIYADDIQSKADQLKTSAGTQSTSELATTKDTDLNAGNTPQPQLGTKAGQLKEKAEALHTAAEGIVTAATQNTGSPLKPLEEQAGSLKNVAGNESDGGLYKAAEDLSKKTEQAADGQATAVIDAFEAVENNYEALMKLAKESGLTNNPNVIEVVKAYHSVKNTYYQMLIGYRFRYLIGEGTGKDEKILKKAIDLYNNANNLAQASGLQAKPGGQDPDTELKELLKQLANALATAVGDNTGSPNSLQKALNDLKTASTDALIVEKAQEVIKKYNAVKDAYGKVRKKEKEYTALVTGEYTLVKSAFKDLEDKFDVLQKSYVNVLRLRVQELSTRAHTIYEKASDLKAVSELSEEANALRDAASSGGKGGLQQKAAALAGAINTKDGDTTAPTDEVIQKFDTVTDKYNDLKAKAKYQAALAKIEAGQSSLEPDEQKVQAVDTSYRDLKNLYDSILNVNKATKLRVEAGTSQDTPGTLRYLAKALYEAANELQKKVTGGVDGGGAQGLATAVGKDDKAPSSAGKPGTLREALNELGSATEGDPKLTEKAKNVKDKYGNTWSGVKSKYYAVKALKDTAYAGKTQYQPVVDAWNAFDKLYHEAISTEKF
ncbi:Tpr-related protein family member, putative [Theileria annulata]|uniref:Tpr-related protein family member, putative n=1 Tax=Theileria annulata TaxID=5874 RepID=Q4UHI4_THEAN|nr:Tpr-related protein family member, putative [Theileria annulata]CAI73455.1 Tpr-related protein family member, putative [Theileria annulata]|eukprot:XP_954132.1 Tpr-related protein family member, putative [Theileria annulata]